MVATKEPSAMAALATITRRAVTKEEILEGPTIEEENLLSAEAATVVEMIETKVAATRTTGGKRCLIQISLKTPR